MELHETFADRIVALYHEVEWRRRSPDIIPCAFYFWSYLKFKVFVTPPRGMQDLRKRIQVEFENLRRTPGVIHNAVTSMEKV